MKIGGSVKIADGVKERAIELVGFAIFEVVTRSATVVFRAADFVSARFPEAARRARERFYRDGPGSPTGYGIGRGR